MKTIGLLAVFLLAVAAGVALFIGYGAVDVGADRPHASLTGRLLHLTRERSIAARAEDIEVPDLAVETLVRRGAGNYDAMCAGCHQRPGEDQTPLAAGLNPPPPDFREHGIANPAEAFWAIKHGIRMTGMPSWGGHMDDETIWGIVAFMKSLPGMTAEAYDERVAASGGHSHGAPAAPDEEGELHVHEDGEVHRH